LVKDGFAIQQTILPPSMCALLIRNDITRANKCPLSRGLQARNTTKCKCRLPYGQKKTRRKGGSAVH
jgi:hypothetical protein